MPNYRESSITAGTVWRRSYEVIIKNNYNEIPEITFNEEEIVDTGTTILNKPVSHIHKMMDDPSVTFNLLHPITGDVLGTATYQDAYVMLSSLYQALAAERDAAAV